MSNYDELRTISKKYAGKEVYAIAADLDISIKTDRDCFNDFNNDFNNGFPLLNCSAILTVASNRYTIYYKPSKHEKYYILHELCHYILKHNADGEHEEQQSNILACMILIPNKDIHKDIFTLSATYNIPSHIVYSYIAYLKSNTSIFKRRKLIIFTSIVSVACILFVSGTLIGIVINNNTPDVTHAIYSETTTEQLTQAQQIATNEIVYITRTGHKYHKPNCFYIKNSKVTKISIIQAESHGYTPCAVCFND